MTIWSTTPGRPLRRKLMRTYFGLSLLAHLWGLALMCTFTSNFREIPPKDVYIVEFCHIDIAADNRNHLTAAAAKPSVKRCVKGAMPSGGVETAHAAPHPEPPFASASPAVLPSSVAVPPHTVAAHEELHGNDSVPVPSTVRGDGTGHAQGTKAAPAGITPGEGTGNAGASKTGDVAFGSASGPAFLYREIPVYPHLARRFGKEGKVLLRLTIDESGALVRTEIIEDPGYGFVAAAIEALRKSRFSPARRNGRPVMATSILPVRFELQGNN